MHEDLEDEDQEELFSRMSEYQVEIEELNAQLDSMEADLDDWRKLAGARLREMKQLSEDYNSLLTAAKAVEEEARDRYISPEIIKLRQLIAKETT